jgi:hypothetical protein
VKQAISLFGLAMATALTFAAITISNSAYAFRDNLQFDHLSWCEDNKVMMSNPDGKSSKVVADCNQDQKICTSGQTYTRDRVTYFAYCK